MVKKVDIEKTKEGYMKFVESYKTVVLNMLDDQGRPFSSTAPFVRKDDKLYIYISQVAEHYHFIEKSEWIDVLIAADESATENPFATERVRFRCAPENIGNEGHDDIFELFDTQFNAKLMEMLRGLDFSLFELTPAEGRYVVGFGLAFDISIDGSVFEHVVIDKEKKPGAAV